ncbi:MAG TPA: VWA domain-containing protein [Acidimicrobiales bacterium]|nr:VWA domain-containing protein [Acidimicrobiales bacterium]
MTFLAPGRLWLLALVPALAAAYVVLQRRRRHHAVRFTNLDLLASVAPSRPGWRRHLAAGAMALALVAMVLGLARPARDVRVPKEAATVMLVVDTSASMDAEDVAPTRLQAAVSAGRDFVAGLPDRLRVGLISFDRSVRVLAPPTTDHAAVADALAVLRTGPGTAAGEAIYTALDVLAASGGAGETDGEPTAAIVLLSDGFTTVGRPADQAAVDAADQGVPVTTIAFGTEDGTVSIQGADVPVPSDPDSMAEVAETTGGTFFEAFSAQELERVYDDIGSRVGFETEQREVSLTFVAGAVVLLVLGLGAALVWQGRIL